MEMEEIEPELCAILGYTGRWGPAWAKDPVFSPKCKQTMFSIAGGGDPYQHRGFALLSEFRQEQSLKMSIMDLTLQP